MQKVLQKRFPEECVWCTHAIVVWAKLHGYTPVLHPADAVTEPASSDLKVRRTYSEPVGTMDWLVTNHKSEQCSGVESDTEVDVVGVDSPQTKGELNDVMMRRKGSVRWSLIATFVVVAVGVRYRTYEEQLDFLSHLFHLFTF